MAQPLKLPTYLAKEDDEFLHFFMNEADHPLVQDHLSSFVKQLIREDTVVMKLKLHGEVLTLDAGKNRFANITAYTSNDAVKKHWMCRHRLKKLLWPNLPCALISIADFGTDKMHIVPLEDITVEPHIKDEDGKVFLINAFIALKCFKRVYEA